MNSLFVTILNMSITASYVALAVMLVRLMLRKAPRIFSYALWAIVLFRLICPVSFESIFSLLPVNQNTIPQDITYSQTPAVNSGINIIDNAVNRTIQNSLPAVQPDTSVNPMGVLIGVGAYFWLLGIIIMLCYAVFSYMKVKRRFFAATLVRDNIFETDQIKTPFVMGFVKPKIYIPTELADNESDYIIKHEQTHIKRRDYLIKPLAFLALSVHWFNPLMWVSYLLMAKDMELSCDESVLKKSDVDIRTSYSGSLLSLSVKQSGLLSPLAFGESNVKARVKNVLNYKKPAFWVSLAALIMVAAVVAGLAVNRGTLTQKTYFDAGTFLSRLEQGSYLAPEITGNLPDFREEPQPGDSMFYLWSMWNTEDEIFYHKIEALTKDYALIRYHYKSYDFQVQPLEIPLTIDEGKALALRFIKDFSPGAYDLLWENKPDYLSLYDPGHVESWVADSIDTHYIIMVDLDAGNVVYWSAEVQEATLKKEMTVEDYANQYIQNVIKTLEASATDVTILDTKTTKLEKLTVFDNLLPYPIEIWSLEYQLKPDDMSKVRLVDQIDLGEWFIDECLTKWLVFSYEDKTPLYLGRLDRVTSNLDTPAWQETSLRRFLEDLKLLPGETYQGNHIVVKFPLSNGETCQLFLSQPVVQGDTGIWCIERWMDGSGNIYYETPQTTLTTTEYYVDLQKQCDEGHKPGLLDPMQVAFTYIRGEDGLRQSRVTMDQLEVQYDATVQDFEETPLSHYIGLISDFTADSTSFHLNIVEWLMLDDTDRLNELNITPDDMPSGFYIHNASTYPMWFGVTEQTQYNIIDWGEGGAAGKSVSKDEFIKSLEKYTDFKPPYRIVTKDGYVQSITEQYVP